MFTNSSSSSSRSCAYFNNFITSKDYIYPFNPNLRNPIVYIMQPRKIRNENNDTKRGFFAKAFDWYTKDRLSRGMNEDESIAGFASWLDLKYDEYHNQVVNKRERVPGIMRSRSVEVILEPKDVTSRPTSICQYYAATAGQAQKSVVLVCSCKKPHKSFNCVKRVHSDTIASNVNCHCDKESGFRKTFREIADKVQPISKLDTCLQHASAQTPVKLCRLSRTRKKTVNLQTSDLYIVVDENYQPHPTFIKIAPPREYIICDKN